MALEQEEKSLKDVLRKEDEMIDNLNSVMGIVDKLMDSSQTYSLGQIANIFKSLQVREFTE